MNQFFVYHPYKSYKYALPMMIGFCILGFVIVGMNLFQNKDFTIFGLIIGASFLFITIYSSKRANTVIVFDEDGLRITMGQRDYYQFIPWESLRYAYVAKNYKGFQYLILSPTTLNENKIRKYVWEGTDGRDIYQNSIVVIHLWSTKDTSKIDRIKEMAVQHGLQFEK